MECKVTFLQNKTWNARQHYSGIYASFYLRFLQRVRNFFVCRINRIFISRSVEFNVTSRKS
jgi:hypothetical protein